jgi:hypothetical protein
MPGRTPAAALDAYYEPLRGALACLPGVASIVRPAGIGKVGDEGMWILNGPAGMDLGYGRVFAAQQAFAMVAAEDPSAGKFRITTKMYSYKLTVYGEDQWRMHWHPRAPAGSDREQRPHIHLPHNFKAHLPTPRMTLEKAIEWCFGFGVEPRCDDWTQRLTRAEEPHLQHRTWFDDPLRLIKSIVGASKKLKR